MREACINMNIRKILKREILIAIIGAIIISPVYGMTDGTTDIWSEFNQLTSDIDTLPSGIVSGNSFMAKVNAAKASIDRNEVCTAINTLKALRNEIRAKSGKKGFTVIMANQIDTDVISIIALLLERSETKKCGGGVTPPIIGNSPETTIISSDDKGIQLHISFPRAEFISRIGNDGKGNDEPFIDMSIDGMGYVSGVGKPDIPVLTQFFAIPIGADVSVKLLGSTSYNIDNIKLWPRQEPQIDQPGFGIRPFIIDRQFYGTKEFYPTDPIKNREFGPMRDLNIGGIETDGAQYIPTTQSLKVYTGMDIKINFEGGNTGKFGDTRILSPWNLPFSSIYDEFLLNYPVLLEPKALNDMKARLCDNIPADIIIVTSHGLLPVAKTYADAKTKDGFGVGISEVGSGPGHIGTTPEEIQLGIQQQINWWGGPCTNRPSYVTIIGDTANVPTFQIRLPDYIGIAYGYPPNFPSDLPYGLRPGSTSLFPNAIIGRIPVSPSSSSDTTDTPDEVIQKILDYEHNPPSSEEFYSRMTFTSYFEGNGPKDIKSNTKDTETIRNALMPLGYNIDRIYTDDGEKHCFPLGDHWRDPCTLEEIKQGPDIPFIYPILEKEYYDGTPIPAELQKYNFLWDGSTQDVIDQWNNGRSIIFHRDHGNVSGWSHPYFRTENISSLNNGNLLPVAFSINCESGRFDGNTPNFDEQLVRKIGGGAVGVIGPSGVSDNYANSHLIMGIFGAIFPSTKLGLSKWGNTAPKTRMGDALLDGKLYMDTQNGIDSQFDATTKAEHYLFHWLGDPTMQIWTRKPFYFAKDIGHEFVGSIAKIRLSQLNTDKALLSLIQDGDVIGRAQLINGEAEIELLRDLNGEPLYISIDKESFIPAQFEIGGSNNGSISGIKFNDSNGNGIRDQEEQGLSNWTMVLMMPGYNTTTMTKTDGSYSFNNLSSGIYIVGEVQRYGWIQNSPKPLGIYNVSLGPGQIVTGLDFGNMIDQNQQ